MSSVSTDLSQNILKGVPYYPFIYYDGESTKRGFLRRGDKEQRAQMVQKVIVQYVPDDIKHWHFVFDSFDEFIQYYSRFEPQERNFFETILGEKPQKLYFDIDLDHEKIQDYNKQPDLVEDFKKYFNEVSFGIDYPPGDDTYNCYYQDPQDFSELLMAHLIDRIQTTFYDLYQVDLPLENILIYSSTKKCSVSPCNAKCEGKHSYHIVVDGYHFPTNKASNFLFQYITSDMPLLFKKFNDKLFKSLQQFRVLGSTKYNATRYKRDFSGTLFDFEIPAQQGNDRTKFLRSLVTYIAPDSIFLPDKSPPEPAKLEIGYDIPDDNIEAKIESLVPAGFELGQEYRDFSFRLNRVSPSRCVVCKRTHDKENASIYFDPITNTIRFTCFREEKKPITLYDYNKFNPVGQIAQFMPLLEQIEKANSEAPPGVIPEQTISPQNLIESRTLLPVLRDKICDLLLSDKETDNALVFAMKMGNRLVLCEQTMWLCPDNGDVIWVSEKWDGLDSTYDRITNLCDETINEYIKKAHQILPVVDQILQQQKLPTFAKYLQENHPDAVALDGSILYQSKGIEKRLTSYVKTLGNVKLAIEIEQLYKTLFGLLHVKNKYSKLNYIKTLYTRIKGINDPAFRKNEFRLSKLNGYTHLTSLANGKVLDFKTLKLSDRLPSHYFTWFYTLNYNPNANKSLFRRFIMTLTGDDEDLCESILLLLGYFMTGETSEHIYVFFKGRTRNGKSTLVDVLASILECCSSGTKAFAQLNDGALFESKSGTDHTSSLNNIIYSRLAICPETDTSVKLSEKKLKTFTGDQLINVREMYEKDQLIRSFIKLAMCINGDVNIDMGQAAIAARQVVVPFDITFVSASDNVSGKDPKTYRFKDPEFVEEVKRNREGNFALLAEYAHKYYQGLFDQNGKKIDLYDRLCDKIKKKTESVINNNDPLRSFLSECIENKDFSMGVLDFYHCYEHYMFNNLPGKTVLLNNVFPEKMTDLIGEPRYDRHKKTKFRDGYFYPGILDMRDSKSDKFKRIYDKYINRIRELGLDPEYQDFANAQATGQAVSI